MSRSFAWRPVNPTPPPSGYISLTVWHLLCTMRGVEEGWTDSLEVRREDSTWLHGAAAATSNDEIRMEILDLMRIVSDEGPIVIEVEH